MVFILYLYLTGNLPEYYSKKYENEHPSEIPYRETPKQYEEKVQPYKHYFPKYTTKYYTTTYKPQYQKKEEKPYELQEYKQQQYIPKEPSYEKEEKGYYK